MKDYSSEDVFDILYITYKILDLRKRCAHVIQLACRLWLILANKWRGRSIQLLILHYCSSNKLSEENERKTQETIFIRIKPTSIRYKPA